MKIDVEGFESRVLRGGSRLLKEQPPKAIVFEDEYENGAPIDRLETVSLLKAVGYRVTHITRRGYAAEERENYLAVR